MDENNVCTGISVKIRSNMKLHVKEHKKKGGQALTEVEFMKLRHHLSEKREMNLLYFLDTMVMTGIRTSDWCHLVDAWERSRTRKFEMIIQKQSRKQADGSIKFQTRTIILPEAIYHALLSGNWHIDKRSQSWIKQQTERISKIALKIGIEREISPHDFRHTFVVFLKHRGWDIADVQSVGKWKDIRSIMHYFESDPDAIEAIYKSLESDMYDISQPMVIMKQLNAERAKTNNLLAKLKLYEEKYGKI